MAKKGQKKSRRRLRKAPYFLLLLFVLIGLLDVMANEPARGPGAGAAGLPELHRGRMIWS